VAEQDYYEVSVAADGSSVIPDIKIRSLPKIKGIVQNPDGTPAPRAVVRLRGKDLTTLQSILTNEAGRFEVRPQWIPVDSEAGQRALVQHVVAFDPYQILAASAAVRLDRPADVVLKLEPHSAAWPLTEFQSELADWERGIVPAKRAAKDSARSLRPGATRN
jgi:hypothetical protein